MKTRSTKKEYVSFCKLQKYVRFYTRTYVIKTGLQPVSRACGKNSWIFSSFKKRETVGKKYQKKYNES